MSEEERQEDKVGSSKKGREEEVEMSQEREDELHGPRGEDKQKLTDE